VNRCDEWLDSQEGQNGIERERFTSPPCDCDLIGLKGEACEHGNAWGIGFLRNLIKPRAERGGELETVRDERNGTE
jgi:hypothetical protein